MKFDLILCGVGGQGILSLAAVIAQAAMTADLDVRQSEVHGMAQRGGAVQAHLRISDRPIHGDLIGKGRADMILSMEPLETLRYLEYLTDSAPVITAMEPYRNIPDYPDEADLLAELKNIPRCVLVPAKELARKAGSPKSANIALVGAASSQLPMEYEQIIEAVRTRLSSKGADVVELNLKALDLGRSVVEL
jgi:indolepyruvate ferredoxin oxidoreductase beta subunit